MNAERYNRQTVLAEFGPKAQKNLLSAKVLVIGAGGLGVPILTYLNAMGVGTLGIVDKDVVSLSNLHRQVLYSESDIGEPKVLVASRKLREQNSETHLITHETFFAKENALRLITEYDVVVDASDNFPTRYLVNDACVILNKPFVYGALHGFEGQVSVFNYNNGPTYRCLFPTMPKSDEVPNCNEHGVLGIIPGIIGNLQALETVKIITGVGESLSGKLLLFNGLSNVFQKIGFSKRLKNSQITELQNTYDFDCELEAKSIAATDFLKTIETKNVELIDVRTEKEFKRNHLEIAINIPLGELVNRKGEIPSEGDLYFICQSGLRSSKAIDQLRNFRLDATLINVSGGMNQITQHAVKH